MENIWKHVLLEGEYPKRARAVENIPWDAVGALPQGAKHSIYQELMHLISWHKVIISGSEELYREWMSGERFPSEAAPADPSTWNARVAEYLGDLWSLSEKAKTIDLDAEIGPGSTFGDVFMAMCAHNAYHIGKIVALRQQLDCWPDEEKA